MTAETVALGRQIRGARSAARMSREHLAAAADVSVSQLGKIERGERGTLAEALRIAAALDVPMSELMAAAEGVEVIDAGAVDSQAWVEVADGWRDVYKVVANELAWTRLALMCLSRDRSGRDVMAMLDALPPRRGRYDHEEWCDANGCRCKKCECSCPNEVSS